MASRRRKCSNVPLAPLTRQTLEMSLQQSLCNGHEDVLRQWLGGDETDGEEQTDGGEEREGERGSESLRNTNINAYDSFGLTSMHYAARLNRYKMMSNLVKKNADPEVRTSEGLTPLHYAARYTPLHTIGEGVVWTRPVQTREGEEEEVDTASVTLYSSNEQILQLLIKKCKVDINVCDEDKDTPLHLACMRGNLVAVGILTSATRVNVDAQNEKGDTPLHFACLNGDPEIVEALLKKEADCLIKNKEKQLAIHLACAEGHVDIVKLILEKHSDKIGEMMNTCDQECNTPLHFACESGSVEIVKLLLLNGADPNACRFHKVTPLHIVAKEGFIDIAKVLLQNKNSEINVNDANLLSPIHYAAQFGRVKMIEFLLSKDADIESQDTDLYTPLLTAAAYGQMEAMKALIKANALIDVVDRTRKTLVFIAAEEDQVHILEALVLGIYEVWGSELVNTTDSIHNTPLHIAAKKGNINSLKVLLQASHLKIDARNEAQRTPLHLAAANGHSNIINALIPYAKDAGKDILKDEDDDGNTALHLACINERFYAAKALILAGADPEDRNARQWTPIDCAAASGKENIVQLLIDAKVEIDPRGINNTTPLQLACKEGHIKVVNKLLENGANVSLRTKGLNALDVAVENGQKDVAMAIVRSKQWESALRNVTYFNQFETEDSTEDDESVATTPSKGRRGATFTTPMRRIIRKMPDVAEVIFNRCCQTNNDKVSTDDPDYKINFMYEFLEDFCVEPQCLRRAKKSRQELEEVDNDTKEGEGKESGKGGGGGYQTSWGPVGYSRKDHCLQILANSKKVELLKHPLAATLIHIKWVKYGQMLYFGNLAIHLLFVIFLTSFALASLSPNSETCQLVFNNTENVNCNAETTRVSHLFIPIGAASVISFAIIKLIFEFIQFIKYHIRYLINWVNYLEILLFIIAILFSFVYTEDCYCPHRWQWELGAIAVFLSWIDLVIFIRKLPITGIYVVMFINIFYIFLKLVFLAILLVLAFAFSFNMLFNDPIIANMGIRTPFMNSWRSIIKTMTMTAGGFNFDSMFRQDGSGLPNSPDIQFPFASYILWILFLILMPILFINLLVGLAVNDIKGMQESAKIKRLALRVELTLTVEEYLPLWLRKKVIIGKQVLYPNKKLGLIKHFFYNVLGFFRPVSAENIKNALHAPPASIERQNQVLARRVDDLCSNVEALTEQNEKLLTLVSAIAESNGHITGLPPSSPAHLKPTASASTRGRSPSSLSEKQTSFI